MKYSARMTDMTLCPKFYGPVPHVGGPVLPLPITCLIGGLPANESTLPVCHVWQPPNYSDGHPEYSDQWYAAGLYRGYGRNQWRRTDHGLPDRTGGLRKDLASP